MPTATEIDLAREFRLRHPLAPDATVRHFVEANRGRELPARYAAPLPSSGAAAPHYGHEDMARIMRYQAERGHAISFAAAAAIVCPHLQAPTGTGEIGSKEAMDRVCRYAAEHGIPYEAAVQSLTGRPFRYAASGSMGSGVGTQWGSYASGGAERAAADGRARQAAALEGRQRRYDAAGAAAKMAREKGVPLATALEACNRFEAGQAASPEQALQELMASGGDVVPSQSLTGGQRR